jgi:hypothetical protein
MKKVWILKNKDGLLLIWIVKLTMPKFENKKMGKYNIMFVFVFKKHF